MLAEQLAGAVIELIRIQIEGLGAGDFAALVIDAVKLGQQQLAWGVDQATLVVKVTPIEVQAQIALAEELAAIAVVQVTYGQLCA